MYTSSNGLYVAHGPNGPISITGKMANRHGLIAGATGTGKTVTLQVLAETFSQAGVPCFMADMKGDLSGISQAGRMSGFIEKRCAEFGIADPHFAPNPTRFYDVFGEQGHPMRTTISNMGPQLLSRLMGLNDVQSGVLEIIFKVADDKGLLLIDLKDLRSMLAYVDEHAAELRSDYGNVTSMTIGAIQRALLTLEDEGTGERAPGLAMHIPTLAIWNINYIELLKYRRLSIFKVSVDDAQVLIYLDEEHPGRILVSYTDAPDDLQDVRFKTQYHHLFTDRLGKRGYRTIRNLVIHLEQLIRYRRRYPFEPRKGSNWVSLPEDFLDWLLPQKAQILKWFRNTWCTDEVFIQSLLAASPFRDRQMDNRREIRFEGAVPHVWTEEDKDILLGSEMLFARKFSSAHPEIIRILVDSLQAQA